jgi:dUTP pyrophosphatase
MTQLKIWKTHPSNQIPKKQTEGSACFDLQFQGHGKTEYKGFSRHNKAFTRPLNNMISIQPGDRTMVPTGLILDIPEGHSVRVHARSGLSLKQGLVLANAEGVIDSDYVEELMVLIWNISDNAINIHTGDRIAQAELIKDETYSIVETAARPGVKTSRVGGMGSTGIKDEGNVLTLNISEPKIPDFIKQEPPKRGRGRPRKNVSTL